MPAGRHPRTMKALPSPPWGEGGPAARDRVRGFLWQNRSPVPTGLGKFERQNSALPSAW
jgi:hypothetical protein